MDKNLDKNISFGGNLWQFADGDARLSEMIAQRCNLPYIMAKIIALRGVSIDDVEHFLSPKISALMPDPYVLKDMQKAAERIAQAIIDKQKIAITIITIHFGLIIIVLKKKPRIHNPDIIYINIDNSIFFNIYPFCFLESVCHTFTLGKLPVIINQVKKISHQLKALPTFSCSDIKK